MYIGPPAGPGSRRSQVRTEPDKRCRLSGTAVRARNPAGRNAYLVGGYGAVAGKASSGPLPGTGLHQSSILLPPAVGPAAGVVGIRDAPSRALDKPKSRSLSGSHHSMRAADGGLRKAKIQQPLVHERPVGDDPGRLLFGSAQGPGAPIRESAPVRIVGRA